MSTAGFKQWKRLLAADRHDGYAEIAARSRLQCIDVRKLRMAKEGALVCVDNSIMTATFQIR